MLEIFFVGAELPGSFPLETSWSRSGNGIRFLWKHQMRDWDSISLKSSGAGIGICFLWKHHGSGSGILDLGVELVALFGALFLAFGLWLVAAGALSQLLLVPFLILEPTFESFLIMLFLQSF